MSKSVTAYNTALQLRDFYRGSRQQSPTQPPQGRKVIEVTSVGASQKQKKSFNGKTPPLAIVALISAFLFAPVGLVLGFIAWRQGTKRNGKKGVAQLAVVASAFQILPLLLLL